MTTTVEPRRRAPWSFTPGDPANRLHPRKYDFLYQFESDYWWFVGMRRIQRSLVPELYAPRRNGPWRVLDAGCGTGGRLAELSDGGTRVGLDLSAHALAYARRRNLDCLALASIHALPFRSGSFDVVMSCDVINLLEDDLSAVREMRRICKPGGIVFLNLPAFQFLGGAHSTAVGMVRRYTRRSLRRLLDQAGLRVDRITYTNCLLFPAMAAARLLSSILPKTAHAQTGGFDFRRYPPIVNRLLIGILALESVLLRWINLPIGSSVTVRAINEAAT